MDTSTSTPKTQKYHYSDAILDMRFEDTQGADGSWIASQTRENLPYITPGAVAARQNTLLILAGRNDCSSYLNSIAGGSAANIFSSDNIRLNPNRPPVGAQSIQNSGADTTIFVNPDGPFFLSRPGAPTYPIGPYSGGTQQAEVAILLHEFDHTVGGIPSDTGNVPLSMQNTATVLGNCGQQIK